MSAPTTAGPDQETDGSGSRVRWAVLGVVVVLMIALTVTFVVRAMQDDEQRQVPTAATKLDRALDFTSVVQIPHIEFRSTAPGPTYGRLAAVPLTNPSGSRGVSDLVCDRVASTGRVTSCMTATRKALTTYKGTIYSNDNVVRRKFAVNGAPSRTRLSSDGSLGATTVFVSGHSYAQIGFSTETRIFPTSGKGDYGNLEKSFTTTVDGKVSHAADLNVWGVTFLPGKRPTGFYATVATGGEVYLAKGDLKQRTLTTLRKDVECPSLSPDGKTLVYKHRAGGPATWRYHALELATGRDWALGETRSVDDQAEWLDNTTVAYGVQRANSAESDVWKLAVAPGSTPQVLIRDAWSPAVVRHSSAPASAA